MFQYYVLSPHMTRREIFAFGRRRSAAGADIAPRLDETVRMHLFCPERQLAAPRQ